MADATTTYRPVGPFDLQATLAPLQRGVGDPTQRVGADGTVWRTVRTPAGPATLELRQRADQAVAVAAWGPGCDAALAGVADLLGERDDPTGFVPRHPRVAEAARRCRGLRIPRCGRVFDTLVPAVLEQRVTGVEARRAWRILLRAYGDPAPGPAPAGMRVVPAPAAWRRVPSWVWRRAGVDDRRARAVLSAAAVADRLEQTLDQPAAEATRRLLAVPGIGPWTVAEVRQRAHGDPDAVSVGDYHLPGYVGWALAGRPVDDPGMLTLLEPYAGHRHRVVALLWASGFRAPRFGPRLAPRPLPG